MALIAGAAPSAGAATPCGSHPWCNSNLPPNKRALLVLEQLTMDEKLSLMGGDDPSGVFTGQPANGTSLGVARLGIPTLFFNDGPAGLRKGHATGMPSPIALASSFDPRLARRVGAVLGDEAYKKGIHVLHAPAVNIVRTPLGGRTFEYFGEDPLLAARTAVPYIKGVQSEEVMANVKHYAANNQETNRFTVNVVADERTLREIYLPAFEASVRRGRVATVMTAYNRVDGHKAGENPELINGILKTQWGFRGFALTDYGFALSSTAEAANAGTDLEMPQAFWYQPAALRAQMALGEVSPRVIDEAVRRILREMFRFGVFDRRRPSAEHPNDAAIPVGAHARVARSVERAGMVLLKNRGRLLPINPRRVRSIAVIGPKADSYQRGGGSSEVDPFYSVTPYEGIRRRAARSGTAVSLYEGTSPSEAAAAARGADLAVVVANDRMTEFADKPCLTLQCGDPSSGDQDALIRAVAAANPRTVVLLETGGPVLMPWIDSVPTVLEAWYPGQEGGTAIAAVLFGDADPGGRLPVTFPRREADIPTAGDPRRYPGVAENVHYEEGIFVGYRHYDERGIAPLFPFGHGLSYTRFSYGKARIRRRAKRTLVSVRVRNRGRRRGTEVVQLYVGMPEQPRVPQPPRWLRAFKKVRLKPGRSRVVTLALDRRAFSSWRPGLDRFVSPRGCFRIMIGRSSRDIRSRTVLRRGVRRCRR